MANLFSILTLSLLIISLTSPATGTFWKTKTVKSRSLKLKTAKLTRFQFYWHDIQSGSNPTSINIVKPVAASRMNASTGFGVVNMIDDPLTFKPENGSKMLGRAQGFYGMVSQEEYVLLMGMTFVFTVGRYSGSTLTVLGRNAVFQKVREMPVIGGTGLFRFARGYVQLTTHSVNMQTRDAIVRYNVCVLHY
ncbi:hypothetical protein QVD17_00964 [Tagetes erecta]|uniref:Dirigent protein n=1 Tax=Tagetes erecta TaxID=13708 RepID=A0AAD8L8V6_TARER|nr:hypothetical protein QVD17_00964 [Tagetes erecta]